MSKPRVIWQDSENQYRVTLTDGGFAFEGRQPVTAKWERSQYLENSPRWALLSILEKLSRRRRRRSRKAKAGR